MHELPYRVTSHSDEHTLFFAGAQKIHFHLEHHTKDPKKYLRLFDCYQRLDEKIPFYYAIGFLEAFSTVDLVILAARTV